MKYNMHFDVFLYIIVKCNMYACCLCLNSLILMCIGDRASIQCDW